MPSFVATLVRLRHRRAALVLWYLAIEVAALWTAAHFASATPAFIYQAF